MEADYIGIDRGALQCVRQNIKMVMALGDFDSVSEEEFALIQNRCPVERCNPIKDETDSELALMKASQLGYDEIILWGGLGGRVDHELVNLSLLVHRYDFTLMDERHRIRCLRQGIYRLKKNYRYLSFVPLEDGMISLKGVAYPLRNREVKKTDIYLTSNEITEEEAEIEIHKGRFLCIECQD